MRILIGAIIAAILVLSSNPAHAKWSDGSFPAGGMPVSEHHCIPAAAGAHPAVIILHGAAPKIGWGDPDFEKMCDALAAAGYYAEFIEYFSQTGAAGPKHPIEMMEDTPVWLAEIKAGIGAMDKNPAVDPHRVALLGFSLGAYLALSTAASDPAQIAAVVEYYGGLPKRLDSRCATMPPTLIIHGEKDTIVPVSEARSLDAILTKYHRPHEMRIYPDANHAFNFSGVPFWYNAAAAHDAWNRTVRFLGNYLRINRGASRP